MEGSGRCDEYTHHIVLRWGAAVRKCHLEGSLCGTVQITVGGEAMDNTNYEDVGHLPHTHTRHTHLKQQLDCNYTYSGSARAANLCLQAPREASI